MQKLIDSFEKVFIQEKSLNSEAARRALEIFPAQKIQIVSSDPLEKGPLTAEQFSRSKKVLYYCEFEGQFFKRCPGATQKKTLTCCNYHVLNLGLQCNMNCSYCYLQSYINSPMTKIYTNVDRALVELEDMAKDFPDHPFRVGTGEVVDSLSLDLLTGNSRKLIDFFRRYPKWTLEFKTKSAQVDQFLDTPHAGNVVVSWSMNPSAVIEKEEHGTASLEERLSAAKKCRDRGFPLAFHIDPMIWHPEWKENYRLLTDTIKSRFSPSDVSVISVGSLRFQPEQRSMMRERFGTRSWVVQSEVFQSEGGKLRYDRELRQEMMKFVIDEFKNHDSRWRIFMCMETPENWIETFSATPLQVPELKAMFKPLPKIPDQTFQSIDVTGKSTHPSSDGKSLGGFSV